MTVLAVPPGRLQNQHPHLALQSQGLAALAQSLPYFEAQVPSLCEERGFVPSHCLLPSPPSSCNRQLSAFLFPKCHQQAVGRCHGILLKAQAD